MLPAPHSCFNFRFRGSFLLQTPLLSPLQQLARHCTAVVSLLSVALHPPFNSIHISCAPLHASMAPADECTFLHTPPHCCSTTACTPLPTPFRRPAECITCCPKLVKQLLAPLLFDMPLHLMMLPCHCTLCYCHATAPSTTATTKTALCKTTPRSNSTHQLHRHYLLHLTASLYCTAHQHMLYSRISRACDLCCPFHLTIYPY